MVRKEKPMTINRYLAAQLGMRRAVTVEAFIMLWQLYRSTHKGADPRTMEIFAEEIGRSPAQVYRWLSDFRSAFPDHDKPGELLDALGVRRVLTVRQVGALQVAEVA